MTSVFISYSSKDRPIATKIARDLQKHGIRIWFDTYELLPGDSLAEKIIQGVQTSDFLLVILSKNSAQSAWVKNEIGVAFKKNRAASELRLIPVLVDDSEVPTELADVVRVDLRLGYEEGLAQILAAVSASPAATVPKLSELVDTPDVVDHVKEEQKNFRGAGYFITTVLSIATIIIAAIAAIPSFYTAFGQKPRVYYFAQEQKLALPPRA
jgi:hypothetical protein